MCVHLLTLSLSEVLILKLTHCLLGHLLPGLYWLLAEPSISILSISMPSIYTLIKRAMDHGLPSLFSTREFPTTINSGASSKWPNSQGQKSQAKATLPSHDIKTPFERLYDDNTSPDYFATVRGGASTKSLNNDGIELVSQSIQVRKDVNVTSY